MKTEAAPHRDIKTYRVIGGQLRVRIYTSNLVYFLTRNTCTRLWDDDDDGEWYQFVRTIHTVSLPLVLLFTVAARRLNHRSIDPYCYSQPRDIFFLFFYPRCCIGSARNRILWILRAMVFVLRSCRGI